ncbi:MAG: SWIM zinc finger family protein [Micromonosporaceae bacterium]|nr:SWIM zinc finger family protein [Micromonosporaceae bacterium]
MPEQAAQRWSTDHILALAPDLASRRAAQRLASDEVWVEAGRAEPDSAASGAAVVWGLARGSGSVPYRTAVDLDGPRYRCSCPSRKYPCKHALGLLLAWASEAIPQGRIPGWVAAWRSGQEHQHPEEAEHPHSEEAEHSRPEPARKAGSESPGPAGRQIGHRALAARRSSIATGLDDLDRWLADQIRFGIAGLAGAGYEPWDAAAARLVDAKATAVAGTVRRLASIASDSDRLLTELGLLRLLISAFHAADRLPNDLVATVLTRCGMPTSARDVLAGQSRIRDVWLVVGVRDEQEDTLLVRRVWLRGEASNVPALVLWFAGPGQAFSEDLPLGARIGGELAFYPGAQPLRALIADRDSAGLGRAAPVPAGASIGQALREYADALARDPWLEQWPMVLSAVVPVAPDTPSSGRWFIAERDGTAISMDLAGTDPWRLVGAVAGRPATISGEWSASGIRPMAVWVDGRAVGL